MKHDFLTQPHSYTRTPRSFKEAHGQHLPLHEQTPRWTAFVWPAVWIVVAVALLIFLDGEVWL